MKTFNQEKFLRRKRLGAALYWSQTAVIVLGITLSGCAFRRDQYQKEKQAALPPPKEYQSLVKIEPKPKEEAPESSTEVAGQSTDKIKKSPVKPQESRKPKGSKKLNMTAPTETARSNPDEKEDSSLMKETEALPKREPELEDSEGFKGRRPLVDPFRVGQKAIFEVRYFAIRAGTLTVETLPHVMVNDRPSYHFRIQVKSNPSFDYIYRVDDSAETYVDHETLLPSSHVVTVNESNQVGDIRTFFNWETFEAKWWENKVVKGEPSEKTKQWQILPYSQNVISGIFYLRSFTLTPGKVIKFRIADAGENLVFKGTVVKRETLKTEAGPQPAVLVKSEIELNGAFKPVGEVLVWLRDDAEKQIVQIESKIKIGTIRLKLLELD